MTIPLLICDDSNMARKQVARSLPDILDVDITFATNGIEGLSAIREGKGEMAFLDLTMPEMDGYDVLRHIFNEGLNTMVVVISADIQPEARDRVMKMGALDFIKKPINKDKLYSVLSAHGILKSSP